MKQSLRSLDRKDVTFLLKTQFETISEETHHHSFRLLSVSLGSKLRLSVRVSVSETDQRFLPRDQQTISELQRQTGENDSPAAAR